MGRGRSGAKGSGGGGQQIVTQVTVQSGHVVDLTNMPLVYGGNDAAVSGNLRKTLETQEAKRAKAKIEYGLTTDANGNVIGGENKGGRGSVHIPYWQMRQASTMTHNHPRGKGEEGQLGGTFSDADLNIFTQRRNLRTMRASASEGTYSITKGSKFDSRGFSSYVSSIHSKNTAAMKQANRQLSRDIRSGKVRYRDVQSKRTAIFNKFLVDLHNDMIAGQSQYGYSYTLEKRN